MFRPMPHGRPYKYILRYLDKDVSKMFPMNLRRLAAVLSGMLALGGIAVAAGPSADADFRIDNKVFVDGQTTPTSESTTIFHQGVVYDFMKQPEEVIVLDKAADRFVLLDTLRKIRAELSTANLLDFNEQLRQSARKQSDPLLNFLADPEFKEEFDETAQELTLSSDWMTYRVLLEKVDESEIMALYREFSDWYARLNTRMSPGSRPATARLLVNEALSRRKATARNVALTITLRKTFPPKRMSLHSEHQLIRHIAESDLDRVTQTRQFMTIFKPVSFEEYLAANRL